MLYYDKYDNINLKFLYNFLIRKQWFLKQTTRTNEWKKGGVRFHENSETRYDRQLSVDGFIFFV